MIRIFLYTVLSLMLALSAQAQTVIKRCADGSTVGGNSYCPEEYGGGRGEGRTYLIPRWGAIAIDTSNRNSFGFSSQASGPEAARKVALQSCSERSSTCEIVLEFKNSCGAVAYAAGENDWLWTTAAHDGGENAEEMALAACERKRQGRAVGKCDLAVRAKCAGSPIY